MAGFFHTSAHGQLNIDLGASDVDLMTPAWRCINLMAAWSTATRGESLIIPTVTGRKSRARRIDELVVGLEIVVRGDATSAGGAAVGGVWSQLADNVVELSAVATPPGTQTGHSLTLTLPNGDTYTAAGFVTSFETQPEAGAFMRVAMDLVIPSGAWV